MIFILIRLTIILFTIGLVIWGIWQIFNEKSKKKSPEEKFNDIIQEQTEELNAAIKALRESESYIRQLRNELDAKQEDINQLKYKINNLIQQGNEEEAKYTISKLQNKENYAKEKEENYKKAIDEHQRCIKIVEKYKEYINDLKQESRELNVRSKLAITEKSAASLAVNIKSNIDTIGLQSIRDELEQKISKNKAESHIDTKLSEYQEDEYYNTDSSVEERLEQFKKEIRH